MAIVSPCPLTGWNCLSQPEGLGRTILVMDQTVERFEDLLPVSVSQGVVRVQWVQLLRESNLNLDADQWLWHPV